MFNLNIKKEWKAISALVGTTVGAGIFGLPYVFSRVGFFPGAAYLLFLGGVMVLLNLMYGEIILRTPGDHQFTGYVRTYISEEQGVLKFLNNFSFFLSVYGALLAYGVKIGEFIQLIIGYGNPAFYTILFFLISSLALYFGLKAVSSIEVFLTFLMILFVFFFFFVSLSRIDLSYLRGFDAWFLFLPYGVILFALNGNSVIPEVEEILREKPEKLKKTIVAGTAIPVFIYLVFSFSVVGTSGPYTSEDALSGLLPILPAGIVRMGAVFGVLGMASSFLTLAYVMREVWFRDYKAPKGLAFFLALVPPFLLFAFGVRGFIRILEFSGALSVSLSGLLILMMFKKAKKRGKREPAYNLRIPSWLFYLFYALFILGFFTPFLTRQV